MKDEDKTKGQLINELAQIRQGIAELEAAEAERKRAEEALRESEERYRELVENANDIIYTHDLEGSFTSANPAATRIYGYTTEEIRELNIAQIVDPEYLPLARQKIREKLEGSPQTGPYELLTYNKEDEPIWVEVSTRLLRREGQPVEVQGIARDITERKRAEEAYRALVEHSLQGLVIVQDFRIVFANPTVAEISGYTVEELLSLSAEELRAVVHPDDQAFVWGRYRDRLEEKPVPPRYEFRMMRKDGTAHWLEMFSRRIEYGGKPAIQVAFVDITERKRADRERTSLLAQVQEQAHQVQQIMDTVPEGVLLLNAAGQVILANPAAQKHLVALADARVGDTLTHLGDRSLRELLPSPPPGLWHELEVDGPPRRVFEVIARPMENSSETDGWVLVLRDVTQEREIQQRIQQQERLAALGQLAAGIAHDFNNILTSIIGFAALVRMDPTISQSAGRDLDQIVQQGRRAAHLIRQVLDFSRKSIIEKRPIDLAIFLKETVKLLERTIPENIRITLKIGPDEYLLNADPTCIQQALMNLAINARDAMPKGGELHFGLERIRIEDKQEAPLPEMALRQAQDVEAGEWVRVTVSDSGPGIPSDELPYIFEPFFTTKPAGKGTGLGLAQVWGIVKQHEGHIDVTTKVGEGTTFTLYLPALQESPPETLTQEISTLPQGQGETILVVEDDPAAREVLVASLETLNYRVLAAANGQEALAVFGRHAGDPSIPRPLDELGTSQARDDAGSGQGIALALCDRVMPEMGGIALLHALRKKGWQGPVILLTGHLVDEKDGDLQSEGVVEWLQKPVSLGQLAQVVARALNL